MISNESLYVISKLKGFYPDLVITNLFTEHNSIYQKAILASKASGYERFEDWLNFYGFTYTRSNQQLIDEHEVKNELEISYPSRTISSITENKDLYYKISLVSRSKEISVKGLLIHWGFEYQRITESSIDNFCAKRLSDEFKLNGQEIADIAGLSRERIRQIINNPRKTTCSWVGGVLDKEVLELIDMMVDDIIFEWKDDDILVIIKNDMKGNVCIIVNKQNEIKCLFKNDIPSNLLQKIITKRMHELRQEDFDILDGCDVKSIMKKQYLYPPISKQATYRGLAKKRDMSSHGYASFLGYCGYGPKEARDNTDEKILNFLALNTIEGKTYISSDPSNQWIRGLASRRGYSIDNFIEFFGYDKATRDFESEIKVKMEFYKVELQKYVVSEGSMEIKLPSDTKLYANLYFFAKRRALTLDELLAKLGFVRININDNMDYTDKDIIKLNSNSVSRQNILNELEKLQGTNNIIHHNACQHERSRMLVNKLKELYANECQICKDGDIPKIIKEDGTFYSEAHHINPISNIPLDNEGEILDHYKNMIIVCPHHHKVLHYEYGGYFDIIMQNSEVVFQNKLGKRITLSTNYHLK